MLLNELPIQTMKARLISSVNDKIDGVNALSEDLQVPHFEEIDILDYMPSVRELTRFPTIGIAEGTTVFQDDVGWSATGVHTLTAVIFYQAPDQRTLAVSLRYLRIAVANSLLETRQLGDSPADTPWGVTLVGTMPGPTLARTSDPQEWLSMTGVTIMCRDEQNQV